jgi:RND family efflux transporter MFP subunit
VVKRRFQNLQDEIAIMNGFTYFARLFLAIHLCLGVGCAKLFDAKPAAEGAPADVSAPVVERVTAGHPARKTLELVTTQPGRIEAYASAPLHSKIAGYVEQVLVDIGDAVNKDEVLVKLWVPELQDDVEQKEALLAQAEAQVKQAAAGAKAAGAAVVTAAAAVAQAKAGVIRAEADVERAKAELVRIQQLAAGGSVTQRLVDESLNQARAAEATQQEAAARIESAEAAHREAQAGVEKAAADQVAAEAHLRVAKADLARAQTMAAYMEIKAPFDGVATARNVDTGHYVQPAGGGMAPLMNIARDDQVRVFIDISEMEAALIDGGENGDPVTLTVPALSGRQFQAKVRRTSWSLDSENRSLRVEIDLPNPDGVLRPGMYATAAILLAKKDDVYSLPVAAIIRQGRETFCCTVEDGKIVRRKIELGLRSGNEVEVVSGIDSNDTVVLARADSLTLGQPVEILEPEKK